MPYTLSPVSLRSWLRAALLLLAMCSLGGCSRGVVYTMPGARADLPPGEPLIQKLIVQEAYYWREQDGRLNIALRFASRSPLGPALSSEWLMSLALPGLPAGRERLYQIATNELRMFQARGADRRRGRSFAGVIVIEAPRHGELHGRYHVTIQQQVFSVLGGWGPFHRGPVVIEAGEFIAIEDAVRGAEILKRTEADGMQRPAAATSRPATSPSTQHGTIRVRQPESARSVRHIVEPDDRSAPSKHELLRGVVQVRR